MAEIFAFPAGTPAAMRPGDGAGAPQHPVRPRGVPDDVWAAVESVRTMQRLDDVRYREIPVPSTLADFGIGVELESESSSQEAGPLRLATGWIMMLYAHEPRTGWDSNWRCVAFARLPLEAGENDPLAPGMYWDGMCDYVEYAEPDTVSGTVTVTRNTAFGGLDEAPSSGCEMRVSWTPLDGTGPDGTMDAGAQVNSWAAFIRSTVRPEEDDCR
ncbi:DUF3000 family protein [Bifidobacterium callitrichidarum]|uniref:DUF3000 domain-containing protein n=1 Tax=Bifidobacterium callitrichidarum TaxID=2052941 RepID=A0A2U2NB33_9BIFI|nr:DUF3000 domain-containing protein [Bifidobacterium callitrichidarum]